MEIILKVVDANNCDIEYVREASRLNETIFTKQTQLPSIIQSKFKPDVWIFAYGKTEDGEILLGKLDINFSKSTLLNHTIRKVKISNIGILPFARHKNVGSELLHKARKLCDKNYVDYMYIFCDKKVVPFYKHCGFMPITKNEESNQQKTLLLVKPVSKRCIKNPNIIKHDFIQQAKEIKAKQKRS